MKIIDALNWCESKLGQALDFDGSWGAQCVDLFNYYFQYLVGGNPYDYGYGVNSAYQLFDVKNDNFNYIVNNPSDPNQLPSPGDILIHWGSLPGSGGHGHVSIIASCDSSSYTVYEQNWGGMYVKRQSHPWTGHERGWMSFKHFQPDISPNERIVGVGGVNYRTEPNTSSSIIEVFSEGDILQVDAWKRGQAVEGNDVWFRGAIRKGLLWSGAFVDSSVGSLPEIKDPVVAPTPVPTPVPAPFVPKDPEINDLVASDFPSWIKFDLVEDPDDVETINKEAYDYYKEKYGQDYQYYPIESCTHWWGDPSAGYTHDGTVNHMINTNNLSVDFVVSANRITKFGSLGMKRVSYTTGPRSMYQWTSENDPTLTEDVYKTMGALHYLVEKKNPRLKNEPIRLHKEFMATSCSNIDVQKVRDYANKFDTGELDITTGQAPVIVTPPVEEPVKVTWWEFIRQLLSAIKDFILLRKGKNE